MTKPVAWMMKANDPDNDKDWLCFGRLPTRGEKVSHSAIPLYTHSAINNGGNLEELNTKVQDASTSLESTPPINTEPVGRYYWESVVDGHFMAVPSEGTIHYEIDDFPLYLHPVKELTDEEIISSAEKAGFHWSEDKGIFVRHHNGSWMGLDVKMVDFARAILRKANEK